MQLGYHLFANMKAVSLHKVDALKAEVVEEYKTIIECLKEVHSADIGHLQEVLNREEQALTEVKTALALEEEKRKKVKVEIVEERRRVAEVEEQAILAFKSSKKLKDIKIEFA